jgi:hypothetical protein
VSSRTWVTSLSEGCVLAFPRKRQVWVTLGYCGAMVLVSSVAACAQQTNHEFFNALAEDPLGVVDSRSTLISILLLILTANLAVFGVIVSSDTFKDQANSHRTILGHIFPALLGQVVVVTFTVLAYWICAWFVPAGFRLIMNVFCGIDIVLFAMGIIVSLVVMKRFILLYSVQRFKKPR